MTERPNQIAVIGSGTCGQGSEPWALAEEVGRLLADAGAIVVCGGLGGVMAAVSAAAAGAGGTVIGIVPGESADQANPGCTHVVATGIGHARNLAVVSSGEAVIAIGGGWGTLAEIGFARKLGRPVVSLGSWEPGDPPDGGAGLQTASGPAQAVAMALAGASET